MSISMTTNSNKPAISDNLSASVFKAQIDHLYQQLPRVLAYSVLVMLLLALALRDAIPAAHISSWMVSMVFVLLVRMALYFRYRFHRDDLTDSGWARLFVLLAGASGLVWGMAGVVLFAPEQLELQALILLVLAGMGAGSAAVLPMYLPAFYAYFPISMIPAGVMMFVQVDSFHVFMGIFDVVFMIGLLSFGRAVGDAFRSSLELRFENIELVRELQNQKLELENANLAKSKFLAAASHDLRQPMHALTLFSEVLDKKVTDEKIRGLVDSISTSVSTLSRLFNALLDISRLDAGALSPDIRVFQVHDVIDRVITDCRPQAEEKGLELSVQTCSYSTETDPVLLERILRNLLMNAIRYTQSGSVSVSCAVSDNTLNISVTDTGVGIAASEQENIFEEFTQLGNPERDRAKGLGLGLSIVRRLAKLLHHTIELHSTPGEGTTFVLQLPLRETLRRDQDNKDATVSFDPQRLDGCVLVVDDDPEVRSGMRALLESWGCQVLVTSNAAGAEDILKRGRPYPDAMLVDYRLPENTTGSQLIKKIHGTYDAAIPALLISGDTEPERLREARSQGVELLHKPVEPARLRAWLSNVTRS